MLSRSPGQIARDVGAALHSRHALVVGTLRAIVGLVFATLAVALVATLPIADEPSFAGLATLVFIGGLCVDGLVGNALRTGIGL